MSGRKNQLMKRLKKYKQKLSITKTIFLSLMMLMLSIVLSACANSPDDNMSVNEENIVEENTIEEKVTDSEGVVGGETKVNDEIESNKETKVSNEIKKNEEQNMVMKIGDTSVDVTWEDNDSIKELNKLAESVLSISMSMYGGFEQVGSIGQSIIRNDVQMTTQSGDIVLYSGNQLVVFYGSNSWSYTKLGKINLSHCGNDIPRLQIDVLYSYSRFIRQLQELHEGILGHDRSVQG